jgi:hypothetical protein
MLLFRERCSRVLDVDETGSGAGADRVPADSSLSSEAIASRLHVHPPAHAPKAIVSQITGLGPVFRPPDRLRPFAVSNPHAVRTIVSVSEKRPGSSRVGFGARPRPAALRTGVRAVGIRGGEPPDGDFDLASVPGAGVRRPDRLRLAGRGAARRRAARRRCRDRRCRAREPGRSHPGPGTSGRRSCRPKEISVIACSRELWTRLSPRTGNVRLS